MKRSVGVVITNGQNEVLLMKRSKSSGHNEGQWENTGGKCEEGELFKDCAIREAKEELGVELINIELIYVDTDSRNYEVHVFKANILNEPKIVEPNMCDEIRWFKISELNSVNLAEYSQNDFRYLGWI